MEQFECYFKIESSLTLKQVKRENDAHFEPYEDNEEVNENLQANVFTILGEENEEGQQKPTDQMEEDNKTKQEPVTEVAESANENVVQQPSPVKTGLLAKMWKLKNIVANKMRMVRQQSL